MAPREQAGDSQFYRLSLAYDNFTNLLCESINMVGHTEMICVSDGLRKRDMGTWFLISYSYFYSCSNIGFDRPAFSVRVDFPVRFRVGVEAGAGEANVVRVLFGCSREEDG